MTQEHCYTLLGAMEQLENGSGKSAASETVPFRDWAVPVVTVLVALLSALFFIAGEAHTQLPHAAYAIAFEATHGSCGHCLPSSSAMSTTTANINAVGGVLDNDEDNDGVDDAFATPLTLAALATVYLSVRHLGGRLLLAVHAQAKPSSIYCIALERPG